MKTHKRAKHSRQLDRHAAAGLSTAKVLPAAETLLVCVKQRHGKGASCAGSGSLVLLKQMQALLAAEKISARELAVKPAGCLGLCKQGPVCVAASDRQVGKNKPSKLVKDGNSDGVFTSLALKDVRNVLREALANTWR